MLSKKEMDMCLTASVGCIDPLEYRNDVAKLDDAGIDGYHFDLSDGHFAPTIILSIPTIGAFRRCSKNRIDVHLYCTRPSTFIDELKENGTDTCIVCVESEENCRDVMRNVKNAGMRAGVSVLPTSDVPENMPELIDMADLVIALMVGPAYPGQPFNPRGFENLEILQAMVRESGRDIELGVDGNVRVERMESFLSRGAGHFVCGSASVFVPGKSYRENISDLHREIARVNKLNE